MSAFAKIKSLQFVQVAVLALGICMVSGSFAPAEAGKRHRSAYVVGTHFPFVSGYRYHPSGYWYVASRSHCRYPAHYYRYRTGVGYVYYGPNHAYYRHHTVRHYQPYKPRRHEYYTYHYVPENRGIFTARGGIRYWWHH